MKQILVAVLCGIVLLTSCNKWLDVKPADQKEREDQYSTESGFCLALSGAYLKMKSNNLYGQAMTMTSMEYLAQLWTTEVEEIQNFMDFDWEGDYAKSQMASTFSEMYNTIYLLNDILIQMEVQGEKAIPDEEIRYMIQGEAFALRAFCHFDILRLFGPSPVDPNRNAVSLPYSETASIQLIPYYSYDDFVQKIWTDVNRADSLLKQVDPVLSLTFEELNSPSRLLSSNKIINDFQAYRRVRFNYWALQAFKARMSLYLGDKTSAYEYATSLINARINGTLVGDISQFSVDIANQWYTLPSETIFAVNCFDLIESIENIFTNRQNVLYKFETDQLVLENLFDNQSADVRRNLWVDMTYESTPHYGLRKYWQLDEEDNQDVMIYGQQIPIFRMSEMYLIAAECAPSLSEGNVWLDEFRKNRGLQNIDCSTQEQLNNEILKEYLKEFYAEGHMFFTYKRLGASEMIWNEERQINVSEYQIPLPDTEYTNN